MWTDRVHRSGVMVGMGWVMRDEVLWVKCECDCEVEQELSAKCPSWCCLWKRVAV